MKRDIELTKASRSRVVAIENIHNGAQKDKENKQQWKNPNYFTL